MWEPGKAGRSNLDGNPRRGMSGDTVDSCARTLRTGCPDARQSAGVPSRYSGLRHSTSRSWSTSPRARHDRDRYRQPAAGRTGRERDRADARLERVPRGPTTGLSGDPEDARTARVLGGDVGRGAMLETRHEFRESLKELERQTLELSRDGDRAARPRA